MDDLLKGGQGRTEIQLRSDGISFGICMALGVLLGAGAMWVGTTTKTPPRPITIRNETSTPSVDVHVPASSVSIHPRIFVDVPPSTTNLMLPEVQNVKMLEKTVEIPKEKINKIPVAKADEFGEELPPPTNLENE